MPGLFENFTRFKVRPSKSDRSDLPIVSKNKEIVNQVLDENSIQSSTILGSLAQFRQLSEDRQVMYNAYDDMKTDSIIAAALEIYADDATQEDEKGRVIWIESDDEEIVKAGERLLKILEIPDRAWKHIYLACLYGDYYLKLFRNDGDSYAISEEEEKYTGKPVKIINDREKYKGHTNIPNYEEYVEDVNDPATIFDLKYRGKTAGYLEVNHETLETTRPTISTVIGFNYQSKDVTLYRPDRFVHISLGDNLSRSPEEVTIDLGDGKSVTYQTARGRSILQDVYPIQKELQLLEDSLLINRLTRSSLIRMLEIEVGDMPKNETNNYLRRIKQLIEQHISLDKDEGKYKSFNSPGPIDNVIYIPVRNGKGSVTVNNLGGDVNVREIADIDYFNNKRAGALKIPRAYLGDDMDGSGLSNGGSLTRISIRYAKTIKRIQRSYIRAIKNLINLFFLDKKLDYINKFEVRMTSPSTQEDLERMELISGQIDLVSSIMSLTSDLDGSTQKKILVSLVSDVMNMPDISKMIEEDNTPEEEVTIEGDSTGGPDIDLDIDTGEGPGGDTSVDMTDELGSDESPEGGFSDEDFAGFEDQI